MRIRNIKLEKVILNYSTFFLIYSMMYYFIGQFSLPLPSKTSSIVNIYHPLKTFPWVNRVAGRSSGSKTCFITHSFSGLTEERSTDSKILQSHHLQHFASFHPSKKLSDSNHHLKFFIVEVWLD